jgi:hypothetical protein
MRVYIAGPMSGIPEFNFPAFFAAEERFAEAGWEVLNPARADKDLDGFDPKKDAARSHAHYMRRDLPMVASCDAIALLPGWRASRGARDELYVARACGLAVLDACEMGPLAEETVLEEAQRLVHGDRGAAYGHPIDDFARTGRIWGAILGIPDVPPEKVGLCMVGVKLSREVNAPRRDNRTDVAGYAETVDMIHARAALGEADRG